MSRLVNNQETKRLTIQDDLDKCQTALAASRSTEKQSSGFMGDVSLRKFIAIQLILAMFFEFVIARKTGFLPGVVFACYYVINLILP